MDPPFPPHYMIFGWKLGYFVLELGEMFEGNFADRCDEKFLLMPSGGSRVRRPGSEDPHQHEMIVFYKSNLRMLKKKIKIKRIKAVAKIKAANGNCRPQ